MGARELDEDWTRKLETGHSIQSRNTGRFRSGAVPKGNTIKSRCGGYVSKTYTLPAVRFAPGRHEEAKFYSWDRPCTYCRYLRHRQPQKIRISRFGCYICGSEYPLCKTCYSQWHTASETSLSLS